MTNPERILNILSHSEISLTKAKILIEGRNNNHATLTQEEKKSIMEKLSVIKKDSIALLALFNNDLLIKKLKL